MDTLLVKRVGGHILGVEVSDPKHVCDLANGARGYEAKVAFYFDGVRVGYGRWDVEGFVECVDLRGRPLDRFPEGDSEAAGDALVAEVRGYLSRLPAHGDGGLVLAL